MKTEYNIGDKLYFTYKGSITFGRVIFIGIGKKVTYTLEKYTLENCNYIENIEREEKLVGSTKKHLLDKLILF